MSTDHPKIANPDYEILEPIKNRWSPRSFADKPVEKEKLLRIFEAARWAPSSYNEQPWSFIVASRNQTDAYERLLSSLIAFNQSWAKTAPVLALSVTKKHFERNGNVNHHAFHDVGLAVGNLLTEATNLNLFVHQMAGFDSDKARRLFEIPESHDPVAAFAIGYLGDPEQLPENLSDQEKNKRSRKPVSDFLFTQKWKKPAYFL